MQTEFQKFLIKAKNRHGDQYDYSSVNYIGSKIKVTVICPQHGPFELLPGNHLRGQGCQSCKRLIQTQEFIKKCQKKQKVAYDYSKCVLLSGNHKIEIICKDHGSFLQRPGDHRAGAGCPKCFGNTQRSTEDFICDAIRVHDFRYDYSRVEYKTQKFKVEIICKEHGSFTQDPGSHLAGHGCPACSGVKRVKFEEFVIRANHIHCDRYQYVENSFISMAKPTTIICSQHGEFRQVAAMHIHNHAGCPKCNKRVSVSEDRWLDSIGLPNDLEHRQRRLKMRNGKKYHVDGFDPLTKTVYEFNGDYWHGNPDFYNQEDINPTMNKSFGLLYTNTLKKHHDLEDNGYIVVSIWESEWKKTTAGSQRSQK